MKIPITLLLLLSAHLLVTAGCSGARGGIGVNRVLGFPVSSGGSGGSSTSFNVEDDRYGSNVSFEQNTSAGEPSVKERSFWTVGIWIDIPLGPPQKQPVEIVNLPLLPLPPLPEPEPEPEPEEPPHSEAHHLIEWLSGGGLLTLLAGLGWWKRDKLKGMFNGGNPA